MDRIEVKEGRSLGRSVIDGVHQPHHIDLFHDQAQNLITEVEQLLLGASGCVDRSLHHALKPLEGPLHQFEIDPLLASEIVIEDGFGHPCGCHNLPGRRGRISLAGKEFRGDRKQPFADVTLSEGYLLSSFFSPPIHLLFHWNPLVYLPTGNYTTSPPLVKDKLTDR